MLKKVMAICFAAVLVFTMAACSSGSKDAGSAGGEKTEVKVFAAASLTAVLTELEAAYEADHQDIDIILNTDSSGTLMQQIQEGASCDIFFSAAQKQMNTLEEGGFVVDGTRKNVVNNQLVVVTQPDSKTKVTGLANISDAESIALADGSVPVGKYTRQAMINIGLLPKVDDPAAITTKEVSDALGGVEISEQGNVSKVLAAVEEGSCEVGTTYYSDTYGHEDKVKIIETVGYDVTGDVIYPIACIKNDDAAEGEADAAKDVIAFLTGDTAKTAYQKYLFDTNVE